MERPARKNGAARPRLTPPRVSSGRRIPTCPRSASPDDHQTQRSLALPPGCEASDLTGGAGAVVLVAQRLGKRPARGGGGDEDGGGAGGRARCLPGTTTGVSTDRAGLTRGPESAVAEGGGNGEGARGREVHQAAA
jgi:hypothetical protein